ncbi:hypothetical protein ACUFFT_000022 [Campylobacter jejuni]
MNNKQALEYLKSELCFIFNTRFRYFDFEIFNLLEKKNTNFAKITRL